LSKGRGIHVVVPIGLIDWDATKRFGARMAAAMTADSSRRYLAKMTGSLREGKIFIDYFRNSREATSVAAYSTRPRACAPISNEAISSFLTKSQSHHVAGTQGTNGCETSVFLDGPRGGKPTRSDCFISAAER